MRDCHLPAYREAGFRATKVGAGWHNAREATTFSSTSTQAWVDMETEKLEAIRSHAGPELIVCLDGHMSNMDREGMVTWDLGIATAVLKALEPFDLFFFEEPLHYNDMHGYAELCRNTSVPVAGGEGLSTRQEFAQYADNRAFDIAQPDASLIGIAPFLDVAAMFAIQEKRVAPHAWSSGAGVAR